MISRPLWTIPISPALLSKLKDAGYEYVEDVLCEANKEELKRLICDANFDFTNFISQPTSYTAAELLKTELNNRCSIVTFSKAIDDLFFNGIPTGKITEFVGAPATGKTQLCLQLCVSVQIPESVGGISASAAYISTNSNFSSNRIKEIHRVCASHCVKIARTINLSAEEKQILQNFIVNDPNKCITLFNVETVEQLRASIFNVQKILERKTNKLQLLIIDSFTFPFYSTEVDIERTKKISTIMSHLNQLAALNQLAVVITNDLTTCILDDGNKEILPSLGETFAHAVHNRLVLGEKNTEGDYTALLSKSTEYPTETVYFQITDGGIRDVPNGEKISS